jgi:hypothetical protein
VPVCEGSCVYFTDPCDAGFASVSGSVDAVSYGCLDHNGLHECRWRVAFDTSSTLVRCSLSADGDAGTVAVDFGFVDGGTNVSWASAASTMMCRADTDLLSPSCFTNQVEMRVMLDGGTAATVFVYGTAQGRQPASAFLSFVATLRSSCAPSFRAWDGGTYPFQD